MSYIRSGSNPEALYIYESVSSGKVEILVGRGSEKWASRSEFRVPARAFDALLARYEKGYLPLRYAGFVVSEIWVDERTGRKLSPREVDAPPRTRRDWLRFSRQTTRIELRYKRDYVRMWRVTWDYIASKNPPPRARRKKTRR